MTITDENKKKEKKSRQSDREEESTKIKGLLEKKLEACERLKEEYLANWKKAAAEFFNYKKKEEERLKYAEEKSIEQIILKFLAVLDNIEKAASCPLKGVAGLNALLKGVKQINSQLKKILTEEGIEEINPQNEIFNPELHEAVAVSEAGKQASGRIVEVIEKGYLLKGKLLRPAKVKVGR